MKNISKIDLSTALVIGAAAFQAYQFGRALNVYDPAGWNVEHVNIGGLMLGVIVNVIVAVAATKIPSITARSRKGWSIAGFLFLLALSPALVAPAWHILLSGLQIDTNMATFLSIGLALAPDLAIAVGGFVTGKSFVKLEADAPATQSKSGAPRTKRTVRTQCAALAAQYACREPQCGWSPSVDALVAAAQSGKNPKTSAASAKAGHVKNQHKPIEIDPTLLKDPSKKDAKK